MENDDEYEITINKDPFNDSEIDIFKPDYKNQKFENSIDFKKWKKSVIDKRGSNGHFYSCSYDNIIFYSINSEDENEESGVCPICYKEICFFCKKEYK
jgi:hypothetical protein